MPVSDPDPRPRPDPGDETTDDVTPGDRAPADDETADDETADDVTSTDDVPLGDRAPADRAPAENETADDVTSSDRAPGDRAPAENETDDDRVPDDVSDALRRIAAAVPTADLHPTGPVRRRQARRRRRRLTVAVGGIAAAAVTVLAAGLLAPEDTTVVVGDDGPGTSSSEPSPSPSDDSASGGLTSPLWLAGTGAEWLPDGSVRPLPTARDDDLPEGALRLSDGQLVTIASRVQQTGPMGPDGAFSDDVGYVMAVFDPEGTLVGEQDIRRIGGYVRIAGEHEGEVVLERVQAATSCCRLRPGVDVSTIDPATFEETPVAEIDGMLGRDDVVDGLLVHANDSTNGHGQAAVCELSVLDLENGESRHIGLPPCVSLHDVALSPDGRRAAVSVDVHVDERSDRPGTRLRLQVVDLESGEVVSEHPLDDLDTCDADQPPTCGLTQHRALAWADDATMKVVVQDPVPDRRGNIDIGLLVPEELRVVTVDVEAE